MGTKKEIVIGEWCTVLDGIGIPERIHTYYYEEYDSIPKDKKLWDVKRIKVEHKVFCDYNGKPIKRNRFKSELDFTCEPISKKYEKVLAKSIKEHPKEYASYIKFLDKPMQSKSWVLLTFILPFGKESDFINEIETIKKLLPSKFTFGDIMQIIEDHKFSIDLVGSRGVHPYCESYIEIILGYTEGDFKDKRILFSNFSYRVDLTNENEVLVVR